MAIAAITPRVRTFVICDDIDASSIEDGVFTLEGVRCNLLARSFPWRVPLSTYLVLSNPRKGSFEGRLMIVNENDDKAIRYRKFPVRFRGDNELVAIDIEIGDCVFPEPGRYTFEIYFSALGAEVLKGEHPFTVVSDEE